MPDDLTISIEEDVTFALQDTGAKLDDLKPILPVLLQIGVDSIMGNFETEGRPTKWTPLAAKRTYTPVGTTSPILRATGVMMASIQAASTITGNDRFEISTNAVQAPAHNFGCDKEVNVPAHTRTITQAFGKKLKAPVVANIKSYKMKMNLPQREFMIIQPDDLTEMEETILEYLEV